MGKGVVEVCLRWDRGLQGLWGEVVLGVSFGCRNGVGCWGVSQLRV